MYYLFLASFNEGWSRLTHKNTTEHLNVVDILKFCNQIFQEAEGLKHQHSHRISTSSKVTCLTLTVGEQLNALLHHQTKPAKLGMKLHGTFLCTDFKPNMQERDRVLLMVLGIIRHIIFVWELQKSCSSSERLKVIKITLNYSVAKFWPWFNTCLIIQPRTTLCSYAHRIACKQFDMLQVFC